jgi:hypothetical protein
MKTNMNTSTNLFTVLIMTILAILTATACNDDPCIQFDRMTAESSGKYSSQEIRETEKECQDIVNKSIHGMSERQVYEKFCSMKEWDSGGKLTEVRETSCEQFHTLKFSEHPDYVHYLCTPKNDKGIPALISRGNQAYNFSSVEFQTIYTGNVPMPYMKITLDGKYYGTVPETIGLTLTNERYANMRMDKITCTANGKNSKVAYDQDRVHCEIIIKEGFSDDPKKYGIKAREDESLRSMAVIIGNVTNCEDLKPKDWKR